ncbi:TPA: adhesin [Salmonella enterica]|uniref:Adhesin n=1 Tax=Salmonella enterica TaxID=28901 RepID=A0A750P9D6_SALER|nr:adhesin [Salmonella enterica]EBQ9899126.1 adhesin [Salmonella enterica subsp. enterica serovar Derby]EBU6569914.1 adhesin [Salmonella enterica subsp. enterica serovar Derby]ECD9037610.1 adhesin [Salmonella enterica subsp. enterica serovar Derby]HAF5359772.1 adhesin [Salmonella enterica]
MLKNIGFISALALYGVVGCVTAEPGNIPLDGLNTISFNVGEIADGEIADLRHSTCTLHLADNKKEDSYNYIEGAICPAGGEECTYSSIMKLNGNITILKQISSGENDSVYKNKDFSIFIKQTPVAEQNDDEGSDIKATIVIKTKSDEKTLNMTGYCGV